MTGGSPSCRLFWKRERRSLRIVKSVVSDSIFSFPAFGIKDWEDMEPTSSSGQNNRSEVIEISDEIHYTDTSAILQAIHKPFLDIVHPVESSLVDHFRATSVFSSDEEQSIIAKPTRRGRARKTWMLLKKKCPEKLEKFCLPAIKEKYPHILYRKRLSCTEDQEDCLRHLIKKRVNLCRFVDLFPPVCGCTDDQYEEMIEDGGSEKAWNTAFGLCMRLQTNQQFVESVKQLLERNDVMVPDDLDDILKKGFPCTCQLPGTSKTPKKRMARSQDSSCGYPSTLDDKSQSMPSSLSLSSQEETAVEMPDEAGHSRELQFDSREEKDSYLKQLQNINTAIYKAAKVKPLFKELDGIKEELSVLLRMLRIEHLSHERDIVQVMNLMKRSKDLHATVLHGFQAASEIKEKHYGISKSLLKRYLMLINEIREATSFVNSAKTVYQEIQLLWKQNIPTVKQSLVKRKMMCIEN